MEDRSLVAVADDDVGVRRIRVRAAEDDELGGADITPMGFMGLIVFYYNVSSEKGALFNSLPINLSPKLGVSPSLLQTDACGITAARIHHQPRRLLWKLPLLWAA